MLMEHQNTALFFVNPHLVESLNKLNFDFFEKILVKNNFKKIKYTPNNFYEYVDFIFIYLYPPIILYNTRCKLKNSINDSNILDKGKLLLLSLKKNVNKTLDYFVESYNFEKSKNYKYLFENANANNLYIIKKNVEYGGKGNFIVSSYKEFLKIKKELKNDFIISKYITNPLLFNTKKFHIRMYFINYINSKNIIKSYLSKYGFIVTAKLHYQNENYDNPDIHDSHFKSTDKDYIFPDQLVKSYGNKITNNITNQIIEILKYVKTIQVIYNLPEAENGFNIHGCDFLVTDDYKVKLLEINSTTALRALSTETANLMNNYLFKNIYNEIIADVFKLDKVSVKEPFIKI
jgi:tubulin monoglycylase TTLL3/8